MSTILERLPLDAFSTALRVHPRDVQRRAAEALLQGTVAEMQTGEGKTLVAGLAAAAFALQGRHVHVATPNHYLAARDRAWLEPAFRLLGLDVALLPEGANPAAKRAAYACHVVYGSGYEFGFDYLRDQVTHRQPASRRLGERSLQRLRGMAQPVASPVQARRDVAIIDEIDAVLVDEACVPLVLSEPTPGDPRHAATYRAAQAMAAQLRGGQDFLIDHAARMVRLSDSGLRQAHAALAAITPLALERPWVVYVQQALKARYVLRRDVDYVVQGDALHLVDEYTGRILADRTWQDGLHQAVETEQGLEPTAAPRVAGRLTRQRFYGLYATLCGLTGTAQGCVDEFRTSYGLQVTRIPLHRPSQRREWPTRYFQSQEAKLAAVCGETIAVHEAGRPVLLGTRTIETSQALAAPLVARGLPVQVLNGKQDDDEAHVVARAGQAGTITIATNMAGRGTDIVPGPGVVAQGGLHVIGVERQESGRVDRQLAGRAGRQGDPGSCRFFVSADDWLVVRWAPGFADRLRSLPSEQGEIEGDFSALLAAAQQRAENEHRQRRRHLLEYDRWLDDVRGRLG